MILKDVLYDASDGSSLPRSLDLDSKPQGGR
jgi:hypothetical protein